MNRALVKLIKNSRVHPEEFKNAFSNKTATKIISAEVGEAWLIQNLGHPVKQVKELWMGGNLEVVFSAPEQSRVAWEKKFGKKFSEAYPTISSI